MWSARWSEREKQRLHTPHWKGFAPVCFLKWRVSSSERANRHSHPSQEHWYGFSPVWVRRWAFRWEDLVYTFLHPGTSQWWIRLLSRSGLFLRLYFSGADWANTGDSGPTPGDVWTGVRLESWAGPGPGLWTNPTLEFRSGLWIGATLEVCPGSMGLWVWKVNLDAMLAS